MIPLLVAMFIACLALKVAWKILAAVALVLLISEAVMVIQDLHHVVRQGGQPAA